MTEGQIHCFSSLCWLRNPLFGGFRKYHVKMPRMNWWQDATDKRHSAHKTYLKVWSAYIVWWSYDRVRWNPDAALEIWTVSAAIARAIIRKHTVYLMDICSSSLL